LVVAVATVVEAAFLSEAVFGVVPVAALADVEFFFGVV